MKVDIIVAGATPAVQAAQQATTTIPIVMVRTGDPLGSGFVASLSRPGRNITGLSNINVEVGAKYVELLRASVPNLSRVGVLVNPGNAVHPQYFRHIQSAGKPSGVTIFAAQVSTANDIQAAFAALRQERAGALIVMGDPLFFAQGERISELALQHRLPTMFASREYVGHGGLMSYGQDVAEPYFRAGVYVDKILKGAKPGDLPVEQPTKFELHLNVRTAKALGLVFPQSMLVRADKVIE